MIFVMLSGLMAFAGVPSLDVGLWLADRRDAQGDVDAIALAGALELPIPGVTQDSAGDQRERGDRDIERRRPRHGADADRAVEQR